MSYLLKRRDVDIASFAETQADWRHMDKGHHFGICLPVEVIDVALPCTIPQSEIS